MRSHQALWLPAVGLAFAFAVQAQALPAEAPPRIDGGRLLLPTLDVAKALAEEGESKPRGAPLRFGKVAVVEDVALGAGKFDAARWSTLANGDLRWTLEVEAPGALMLDFAFRRFRLPHDAELRIVGREGVLGPYTDADNRAHGEFYTPLLAGDVATLELTVPADRRDAVELELGGVTRAFRSPFAPLSGEATLKSGSCNLDVVCPQGDSWRDQISAVARYTVSGSACTGQLIADASRANNRVFATANHCISTDAHARGTVYYWRYESPTCREVGSTASGTSIPLDGNFAATQSGARLLGSHADSDFTVVELETEVPQAAQAIASGWDRRENVPPNTFTVHHPLGHEKRISFDSDPPQLQNGTVTGITGRFFWHVLAWNLGTTEGGSSGAGLWNPDGRLIGVLTGGEADCSNNVNDFYGRLSTAWDGGGTPQSRVRDWLDPFNTGAQFADGGNAPQLDAVTLDSPAFATPPVAGATVRFTASASGGTGPYTYRWDLDGDGQVDRSSSAASIDSVYPHAGPRQVSVHVTDSAGAAGNASRALDVRGPRLVAEATAAPTQLCGNNDNNIDPGERWQLPVRLRNDGNADQPAAHALFAVAAGGPPLGPSPAGYTATTSALGGCGFGWIDLVSGANAVAGLTTSVADNNTFGPLDDARTETLTLGGSGFDLYGQRYTQAVMSTNGYLSFNAGETGGDFAPSCSAGFGQGAQGPQLRPFHDDLVVSGSGSTPAGGAGLRYRYFATCPRAAEAGGGQGCHVFAWTRMQLYVAGGPAVGDFDFQAIAYEGSGQIAYQFRNASPNSGETATIGIVNSSGSEAFNVACSATNAAPAQSAACLFAPQAQPPAVAGLRLTQAAPALPAIGAGQNWQGALPFFVPADTACGSPLRVDYIASALEGVHSFDRRRVLDSSVGASCQTVSGCAPPEAATVVRPGLYFSNARPGNGVLNFVYPLGGARALFGGAWYSALPDRTPVWYTLEGEVTDGSGELPIRRFVNAAAPSGFNPAAQNAGRAWVAQLDADSLLLAWELADGRSGAERMDATPLPFGDPNHTQTWYSTSQPGWGLAIESLNAGGPLEFIGAFFYDAAGNPRWVVGDIGSLAGGGVALTGHRPHCPACPWIVDWTADGRAAGTLQLDYVSRSSATLNTAIELPAPLEGSWVRNNVLIVPIAEPVP